MRIHRISLSVVIVLLAVRCESVAQNRPTGPKEASVQYFPTVWKSSAPALPARPSLLATAQKSAPTAPALTSANPNLPAPLPLAYDLKPEERPVATASMVPPPANAPSEKRTALAPYVKSAEQADPKVILIPPPPATPVLAVIPVPKTEPQPEPKVLYVEPDAPAPMPILAPKMEPQPEPKVLLIPPQANGPLDSAGFVPYVEPVEQPDPKVILIPPPSATPVLTEMPIPKREIQPEPKVLFVRPDAPAPLPIPVAKMEPQPEPKVLLIPPPAQCPN